MRVRKNSVTEAAQAVRLNTLTKRLVGWSQALDSRVSVGEESVAGVSQNFSSTNIPSSRNPNDEEEAGKMSTNAEHRNTENNQSYTPHSSSSLGKEERSKDRGTVKNPEDFEYIEIVDQAQTYELNELCAENTCPHLQPKKLTALTEHPKEPVTENHNESLETDKPLVSDKVVSSSLEPKEASTRIESSTTAEQIVRVRMLMGRSGVFRVRSPEGQAASYIVDLNAKTCTCPCFTDQRAKCKHIELVENTVENRRQKRREYLREYLRGYYRRNRDKHLDKLRRWRKKRLEAYRRFKIEFGGKCSVCGEDDLDVLEPHHPDGKIEKGRAFILSKEFTNWIRYGIKPNVVLMCANHHQKLHTAMMRGEVDTP